MAPEQFAGAHCDEKVDVFALATILNECATRRPPWRDFGNAFQVCISKNFQARVLKQDIDALSRSGA